MSSPFFLTHAGKWDEPQQGGNRRLAPPGYATKGGHQASSRHPLIVEVEDSELPRTGASMAARLSEMVVVGSFFRRPLGMFVAVLVVGFALLAVGMTAFGGGSGGTSGGPYHVAKPLSPAQFRRAGVRICLSLRSQLRWLATHKPSNLREVTRYEARATAIFDRLTREVDAVVPPPSAAAAFRRLRRNLGLADGALHRLNHLTETHQWRRAVFLIRSPWWKNIERRLGPPLKLRDMHCGQASHTLA